MKINKIKQILELDCEEVIPFLIDNKINANAFFESLKSAKLIGLITPNERSKIYDKFISGYNSFTKTNCEIDGSHYFDDYILFVVLIVHLSFLELKDIFYTEPYYDSLQK